MTGGETRTKSFGAPVIMYEFVTTKQCLPLIRNRDDALRVLRILRALGCVWSAPSLINLLTHHSPGCIRHTARVNYEEPNFLAPIRHRRHM